MSRRALSSSERRCRLTPASALILVALTLAAQLRAQEIWTGGGGDNNWSTNANWLDGTAPLSPTSTAIQFAGSTRLSPIVDSPWTVSSLTFNSGAGAFTLSGSTLSFFGGAITNLSTSLQTITNTINLSNETSFNTAVGDLSLGALSGTGSFVKIGGGILTVTGNIRNANGVRIEEGTLQIGNSGDALYDVSPVTINGGKLSLGTANEKMGPLSGFGGVIDLNSHRLTVDDYTGSGNGDTTYYGVIQGSGSFEKQGAATLTLAGANTFTGGVVITGGTLALGSSGALGPSGIIQFLGGTLQYSSANTTDYSARIASNTGSIRIDTAGQNITFATALASSNTGGLVKTGGGTLTFLGANLYSGPTTVSGGTLAFNTTSGLYNGNTGNWTANNLVVQAGATAAFRVGGSGEFTLANIDQLRVLGTNTGGFLSGSALGIDTTNAGALTTYTSTIGNPNGGANALGITKLGPGTLTLTATNTYTGATTVEAGTLQLGNSGTVLADTSAVVVNAGGTLKLGSASETIGSLGGTGGMVQYFGNGQTLFVGGNNSSTTYSGVIQGSNGLLMKQGTGTLTLAGTNTYSNGGLQIEAGTIQLGSSGTVLPDTEPVVINGGKLRMAPTVNETIASLAGTGGSVEFVGGGQYLIAGGNNASTTYAGIFEGVNGGIDKQGTGTLTLTGTSINSNGLLAVDGGTVQLGSSGTVLADDTLVMVNTGGTFALGNANETIGPLTGTGIVQLSNGRTLTITQPGSGTGTFAGVIQGSGGAIALAGGGTVLLSGSNTYTGGTTINAGTLVLGASQCVASTGAVTINNGAILDVSTFSNTIGALTMTSGSIIGTTGVLTAASYDLQSGTITGSLGGTGTVTKSTAGTLQLGSSGTVLPDAGALVINGGKVRMATTVNETVGSLAGTGGSVEFVGGGQFLFAGGNNTSTTYAGIFEGANGGIYKQGTGTLTLTGTSINTNGLVVVDGGTVQLGNSGTVVPDDSRIIVNTGGTFALGAANEIVGPLTGTGGTIELFNGAGRTLTINQSTSNTYSGVIQGAAGTIRMLGPATLTLSGSSTFTGGTIIDGGAIALGASNSLPDTGAVTINNGCSFALGAFNDTIGALTLTSGSITGTTGTLTASSYAVESGAISANLAGTGALTKSTAGTVTLTGSNTYTGGTTVNAGILQLNNTGAALSGTGAVVINGGTLKMGTASQTIGSLAGTGGTVQFNGNTQALIAGGNNTSTTYAGVIQGSNGYLYKQGTGTLTLTGTNTFTAGGVQVDAGTLQLGNSGTVLPNDATVTTNGGTFALGTSDETVGPVNLVSGAITSAGGTLTASSYAVQSGSISANLSGTANLIKVIHGLTVTLSGNNSYTGGTTISGGILALGSNGALGTTGAITFGGAEGGGVLQYSAANTTDYSPRFANSTGAVAIDTNGLNVTFASVIGSSNTGGLYKTGAGTLILSGNNSYSGLTTIIGGTLALGTGGNLPDGSLVNIVGGTLDLGAFNETVAGVVLDGGSIVGTTGTLTVTSYDLRAGTIAAKLAGLATITKSTSGTVTLSGSSGDVLPDTAAVAVNDGTLALGAPTETIGPLTGPGTIELFAGGASHTLTVNETTNTTYLGVIQGNGTLVKSGAGTLTLTNNNTQAVTTINAGTLQLGASGAVLSDTGAVVINGGKLRMATTVNETIGSLAGTGGSVEFVGGGQFLFAGGNNTSTTYAGIFEGANGGIYKQGTGTLTLTGTSINTNGLVVVDGGTVQLGNSGTVVPDDTRVIVNTGTTFALGDANETIGTLSGTGTVQLFSGRTLTITQPGGGTGTFAGVIQGSGGAIALAGGGAVLLSGSNTYTGGTTINAGALVLGASQCVASTGAVTINNGTTLDIGTFSTTIGALTMTSGSIIGTGTLMASSYALESGSVAVNLAGAASLTKSAGGTVTLTGVNSYTGGTTVNAGILQLSNSGTSLPDSGALVINGGTLKMGAASQTIGSLAGTGGSVQYFGNGQSLIVGGNNASTTYGGIIAGANGWLEKVGTGTLTLTGTSTYTGGAVVVQNGTVQLGNSGTVLPDTSLVTVNAGTFALGTGNETVGAVTLQSGNITSTGGALIGSSYDVRAGTISAGLGGTGALTKNGTLTVTLSGSNTYTGGTTVANGTLALGSGGSLPDTGALTVNGGTFDLGTNNDSVGAVSLPSGSITGSGTLTASSYDVRTGTISANLAGAASLTKTMHAGTVTLSGNNSYTGGTFLNDGVISLASSGALGTTGPVTFNGLGGNAVLQFSAGNTVDYSSRFANSTACITIDTNGQNVTFASAIGSSNTGGLLKTGPGTLTLSGNNSYTGITYLFDGTLSLGHPGALGSVGSIMLLGGTLQFSAGNTVDYSSRFSTSAGQNYKIDTNGQNVTFASALTSSGAALTKLGAGTLTLTGANTYSGGTTISAGTLRGSTASLSGTIVDNSAVVFDQTFNGTHSGTISGSGSLGKTGPGVVTLSGTYTYSGPALVFGGTLLFAKKSTFYSGNSANWTAANLIVTAGGTAGFRVGGTGEFTAADLDVIKTVASATGGFQSGSSLGLDTTNGNFTYGGGIADPNGGADSLGITKLGTGTLTLTATNSYTGATTIEAGTLQLGSSGTVLSDTGAVVINGGKLRMATTISETIGSLAGSGGSVEYVGGGQGLFAGGNNASTTYGGIFEGANGGLFKQGTGTLTLTGTGINTNGLIQIDAGTVQLGNSGTVVPDDSRVVVNTGGTFALGAANETIGSLAGSGTVELFNGGSGRTLTTATNATTTFSGTIQGSGGSLVKAGTGTFILAGTTTYTGTTTVTGGLLQIDRDSRLGVSTLVLNGGGLRYGAAFNDLRAFTLGTSGGTLDTNGFDVIYSPVITGAGSITKTGAGNLMLSGANDYSGGTIVNAGFIQLDQNSRLGTGSLTFNSGGIRYLAAFNDLRGFSIAGTATLDVQSFDVVHGAVISGAGALVKTGSGTLTLTGSNTYPAGTVLDGGTLQLGDSGTVLSDTGGLVLNAGTFRLGAANETVGTLTGGVSTVIELFNGAGRTLTINQSVDRTYAGVIQGSGGSLVKTGPGTLTLAGANTYSGSTAVTGGFIAITADSQLGTGPLSFMNSGGILYGAAFNDLRAFTLGSGGGTLHTNGFDVTYAPAITGPNAFVKAGAGTLTLSTPMTLSGPVVVSGGFLKVNANSWLGSGSLTLNGGGIKYGTAFNDLRVFNMGAGGATLDTNGFDVIYSASLSGSGTLKKSGAGTLTLTGSNNYGGETVIAGGTLKLGNSGNVLSDGGTVRVNSGTFALGAANETIGGLEGNGGTVVDLFNGVGRTLTISNNSFSIYYGVIQGNGGSLVKNGSGYVALYGPNTYSGGTTINGGTLEAGGVGSLGTGPVAIAAGAILSYAPQAPVTAPNNFTGAGTVGFYGAEVTVTGSLSGFTGDINVDGNYGSLRLSGNAPFQGTNTNLVTLPTDATLALASDTGGTLNWQINAQNLYDDLLPQFVLDRVTPGAGVTYTLNNAFGIRGDNFLTFPGIQVSAGANITSGTAKLVMNNFQIDPMSYAYQITFAVNGPAQLAIGNSFDLDWPGLKTGDGTLALGQDVTAFSGFTIDGGTLQLGLGGTTGWLYGGLLDNGTLAFNRSDPVTWTAPIVGDGGVLQMGPGTLTLTGSNSYFGGTIIRGGTLVAQNNGVVGSGTVRVEGGVFVAALGVTVTNTIELAGGRYDRQLAAGVNLTGAIDAVSGLPGGTRTVARLLEGQTITSTVFQTTFSLQPSTVPMNDADRISDVYSLTGTGTGSTPYVLQLEVASIGPGNILGWMNPAINKWVNAVEGNSGGGVPVFVLGPYDHNLVLGHFGVDVANHTVWAVINHNSEFAVVPEPSALSLLVLASGFLFHRRKRTSAGN